MGGLNESLGKLLHVDATTVGWITTAIVIVAAVLALWGIWWLWWRFPKWQMRSVTASNPKERADIEDNFRKTIGQALGGIAVLIGAAFAYLQFTQQQQATQAQLQSQHDLLISNQVAKGFEQLAGRETVMRLGGIYSLEGVMNTSSDYHQPVLEALCAFVRDSTIGKVVNDQGPATDVQAALTVIGRRKLTGSTELVALPMDLRKANIPGAILLKAHLEDAGFGEAHLEEAYLVAAHLEGATFPGTHLDHAALVNAHLEGAFLRGAHLDGAYLRGAHLEGADLGGAHLDHAALPGAHLDGAYLGDADLSDARNLVQEQLDKACGAPKGLPEGLHLDKPCPEP
jgi:uncharacterized protein YjbI with pentapeptide repeats